MGGVRAAAVPPWCGRRWAATAAVVGSVALCAGADPASAALGPGGVRPGNNVTVFHNIDFVATFGHAVGGQIQVDVVRDGHRIATARGAAVNAGSDGGALEVNHGPEGAPQPGDCWTGATPDIRPGDHVVVSNPGGRAGTDEVIVDEVTIDSVSRRPGADAASPTDDDEVWVEGRAVSGADGTPLDVAILDSGEFRDPLNNPLRMEPNEVVAGAQPGTYVAKYRAPFSFVNPEAAVGTEAALQALLRDGHAFGYGHVPLPSGALRADAMLVEGVGAVHGPAVGCEASPAEDSSAGTLSTDVLNFEGLAGKGDADSVLTVGGWAAPDVTAAEVVLAAGGSEVTRPVALSGGAGPRGWSAEFTRSDLAGLAQGAVAARLRVGGTLRGAALPLRLDTEAPPAPTIGPAGGTYTAPQTVALSAEAGARIHFTTDGSQPTTASERFVRSIAVDRDATVRAIAVDAAGNVSPVASASFAIAVPAPVRSATPAAGVLGTTAASPAALAPPAPGLGLQVRRLSLPARLSRAAARRFGVVTSFVAPAGASYTEVRLLRIVGGARRLIGTRLSAATAGTRQTARFTSAATRRRLAAGRYVLEVRTGASPSALGAPVRKGLRIG